MSRSNHRSTYQPPQILPFQFAISYLADFCMDCNQHDKLLWNFWHRSLLHWTDSNETTLCRFIDCAARQSLLTVKIKGFIEPFTFGLDWLTCVCSNKIGCIKEKVQCRRLLLQLYSTSPSARLSTKVSVSHALGLFHNYVMLRFALG